MLGVCCERVGTDTVLCHDPRVLITPNPGRTLHDALEVMRLLPTDVHNVHSAGVYSLAGATAVGPGSSAVKMWPTLSGSARPNGS